MKQYKIGQRAVLEVLERTQKEEGKMYYIVTDGESKFQIGAFKFQEQTEVPKTLACMVKEINKNQIIWTQDFEPLVKQFYKVGETYPFYVETDYRDTINRKFYVVRDSRFFKFHLDIDKTNGQKLWTRQKVMCKVISMKNWMLELLLVEPNTAAKTASSAEIAPITEERQYISPYKLAKAANINLSVARFLLHQMQTDPAYQRARRAYQMEDADWIIKAIAKMDETLIDWVRTTIGRGHHNIAHLMLESLRKVSLYLLEESSILKTIDDERQEIQELLSNAVENVDIAQTALELLSQGEERLWIDHILKSLRQSGYIYHPEEKLKTMMHLLSLRHDLCNEYMDDIFDIITSGKERDWHIEPFRGAMLRMLEMYVAGEQYNVNVLSNAETPEGRQLIESVVKALAIELFLSIDSDGLDRRGRMAMLCRLLTYSEGVTEVDDLLRRSLECICFPYNSTLDYGWEDLRHTHTIAQKLSKAPSNQWLYNTRMMEMEYGEVLVRLIGKTLIIRPKNDTIRNIIPQGLFPALDIEIYVDRSINDIHIDDENTVIELKNTWAKIEQAVFNPMSFLIPAKTEKSNKEKDSAEVHKAPKVYPHVGDTVHVIATNIVRMATSAEEQKGIKTISKYSIHCQIYDDQYIGEGTLDSTNLVSFYVATTMENFMDVETHQPIIFPVEIQDELEQGRYIFTARRMIEEFMKDETMIGEEILCKVKSLKGHMSVSAYKRQSAFLCLGEYGHSIVVPKSDSLMDITYDTYIKIRVDDWGPTGQVIGSFIETTNDHFEDSEILTKLMSWYSTGVVDISELRANPDIDDDIVYLEDEPEQSASHLENRHVKELVLILDRLAVSCKDQALMYNYLSLAHMLARISIDTQAVKYYADRKRIVELLYDYALNRQINEDEVRKLAESNSDLVASDTKFNEYLTRLKIIGAKGQADKNEYLWETYTNSKSETIKKISTLMLSRNLLDNFGNQFAKEKKTIVDQISEILNIVIPEKQLTYLGEESQTIEFKSSLVTPAGTLHPDEKKQKRHIMERLCGMLNTDGGTLYIGVNNQGIAAGLDSDMKYFQEQCRGPQDDPTDKFLNCFDEAAYTILGTQPAQYIVSRKLTEIDGRTVFKIDVKQCPDPVSVSGHYFVRYGATTREVKSANEIRQIREKRIKLGIYKEESYNPQNEADSVIAIETAKVVQDTSNIATSVSHAVNTVNQTTIKQPEQKSAAKESTIATSQYRLNEINDWSESFVPFEGLLYLLPKSQYQYSPENIWKDEEAQQTIAIYSHELSGYMVIVYESGRAMKVPIKNIVDKDASQIYKRYDGENVVFACPCHADDALMMVCDQYGKKLIRVEHLSNIVEDSLQGKGEVLFTGEINGVIQCDIIPADKIGAMNKLVDRGSRNVGDDIDSQRLIDERAVLAEIGITFAE